MPTVDSVMALNNALELKFTTGALLVADYSSVCPSTIFGSDGTLVSTLASANGFVSAGAIDPSGIVTSRGITNDETQTWQTSEVTRSDVSQDQRTFKIMTQETNNVTLALSHNQTLAAMPALGTALALDAPADGNQPLRRFLLLGHDPVADVIIGRLAAKAKVTGVDDESWIRTAITMRGFTLSAYRDSIAGFSVRNFYGGPGWLALAHGGNATGVAVAPPTASLSAATHATSQLAVTATYPDTTTAVVTPSATYASSDATKATVSSSGLITAQAVGTATITASYQGVTTTCVVTVTA